MLTFQAKSVNENVISYIAQSTGLSKEAHIFESIFNVNLLCAHEFNDVP